MDHQQYIFPSSSSSALAMIMAVLTFIIMAIQIYNQMMMGNSNRSSKLPPGPRTLPIIGNMHQLVGSLPHRRLAELAKKHGPVMYLRLGQVSTVVVSSRQAAEEVLRTNDTVLAQRPATVASTIITYNNRDIVFAPYGEYWRHMRKIFVLHLASTKQVKSFEPVRGAEVTMLVRSIVGSSSSGGKSPVNLSKMLNSLTTSIISRATFGDSCKRVDAFAVLSTRITEILAGFSIAEFFPSVGVLDRMSGVRDEAARLHREIDDAIESVIGEYRAASKEKEAGQTNAKDILGVLLDLQDQADPQVSLSMESIKAMLLDVFTGGIETSATVVEWTMSEILRHPEIMKIVQAEVRQLFRDKSSIDESSLHQLSYMNAVIKETLRLHPPLPLIVPREARERLTINGYEIPSKTRVLVNAWAIGRDPEVWEDAEKFYPERFLETSIDYKGGHFEFIPFGAGRRMCPGVTFGMSVVELTLANLLHHFDWELPHGLKPEFMDMSEHPGIAVGRKFDLCLVATQHYP